MKRLQKAFTLIELMIVVAIMGILVSMTLPSYQQYTVKSQIAEALMLTEQIKPQIIEYYRQQKRLPRNNQEAGLPNPEYLIGNYVKSIAVENGALHVEFGNKINKSINGRTLSLQPLTVPQSPDSPISWSCGYAQAPEGMQKAGTNNTDVERYYLPVRCRI